MYHQRKSDMIGRWHLPCDLEEWCQDKKEEGQAQNLVRRQVCIGEGAVEWESMDTDWERSVR